MSRGCEPGAVRAAGAATLSIFQGCEWRDSSITVANNSFVSNSAQGSGELLVIFVGWCCYNADLGYACSIWRRRDGHRC